MIIIYGVHTKDWNTQLNSNNKELWDNININTVLNISTIEELITVCKNITTKIYLYGMLENDMIDILNTIKYTNIIFIGSTLSNIKLLRNKKLFYEYMKLHNLLEYLPIHFTKIDDIILPFVKKPLCLNGSSGIELNKISDFDNYIYQEFINNKYEYVSHIYCINGIIKNIITYKYKVYTLCNNYYNCTIEKYICKKEYSDIFQVILNTLQYSGFCCIDYKITKELKLKIFEINPRLGGSLMRKENIKDLAILFNTFIFLL